MVTIAVWPAPRRSPRGRVVYQAALLRGGRIILRSETRATAPQARRAGEELCRSRGWRWRLAGGRRDRRFAAGS